MCGRIDALEHRESRAHLVLGERRARRVRSLCAAMLPARLGLVRVRVRVRVGLGLDLDP